LDRIVEEQKFLLPSEGSERTHHGAASVALDWAAVVVEII
jgi:hypothetical protein